MDCREMECFRKIQFFGSMGFGLMCVSFGVIFMLLSFNTASR